MEAQGWIAFHELPAPLSKAMVKSQPMLPVRAMSGSVGIQWQESVLMSLARISTRGHRMSLVWAAVRGQMEVQGLSRTGLLI